MLLVLNKPCVHTFYYGFNRCLNNCIVLSYGVFVRSAGRGGSICKPALIYLEHNNEWFSSKVHLWDKLLVLKLVNSIDLTWILQRSLEKKSGYGWEKTKGFIS